MDYQLVLERLLQGFDRIHLRYGLTGGFALGALGAPRATQDLDFLVHRDDLERLHDLLTGLDYRRIFQSENVSQYEGQSAIWGCLDFIHAFRELATEMLERALEKPIFGGSRRIRVLTPEDVIGLKIQAMANEPKRKARETADIQSLAAVTPTLDWSRVSQFYELFGMRQEFQELKKNSDAQR